MEVYERETTEIVKRFLTRRLSFPLCIAALDAALSGLIPRLTGEQIPRLRIVILANDEIVMREMERRGGVHNTGWLVLLVRDLLTKIFQMAHRPDLHLRKLDSKPHAPLTRQWRGRESKLIEYSGIDGRTYFCNRGLDGAEEWFLAEVRFSASQGTAER
jgi:hypothetical protein